MRDQAWHQHLAWATGPPSISAIVLVPRCLSPRSSKAPVFTEARGRQCPRAAHRTCAACSSCSSNMITAALRRQAVKRVVQSSDAQRCSLTVLGEGHRRHYLLVHEGNECIVDLEIEPASMIVWYSVRSASASANRSFLRRGTICRGDGNCACWRDYGKEAGHAVGPREPSLDVGDIALQFCLPGID